MSNFQHHLLAIIYYNIISVILLKTSAQLRISLMANEARHYLKLRSEPRGVLTESHPASAGLPTFVAGRQKWVAEGITKNPSALRASPLKKGDRIETIHLI